MLRSLPALAALAVATPPLAAQVGLASSTQTVVLTAAKQGSVRVALPGGSAATLAGSLGLGPNDFAPVAIETTWDLDPSVTSAVSLVAYFPVPAAAFTGAGTAIPSSAVSARVPSAGQPGFAPFTGAAVGAGNASAGVTGGTVLLFSQPVTAGGATGTRTDQLQVRLDLTGWTALPPGPYQGTLNLLAITQ
ncbi:MAG TPA: hypothetical protein VFT84_16110 [Gemmatimonadales bacterium]|nr:hypothetical protein [Gemmatimonadales bacterium]